MSVYIERVDVPDSIVHPPTGITVSNERTVIRFAIRFVNGEWELCRPTYRDELFERTPADNLVKLRDLSQEEAQMITDLHGSGISAAVVASNWRMWAEAALSYTSRALQAQRQKAEEQLLAARATVNHARKIAEARR